jgi:hypothetical protein
MCLTSGGRGRARGNRVLMQAIGPTFAICYLLFVIPGEPQASPARHGFPLTQNP